MNMDVQVPSPYIYIFLGGIWNFIFYLIDK